MAENKSKFLGVIKPMILCHCGCGKEHGQIPPGSSVTEIGGWHRVRIKTANDISGTTEIGCGNDPNDAVKESWDWWFKEAKRLQRKMNAANKEAQ